MLSKIEKTARQLEKKIIAYRRDFHKYPEIGWTEFRTSSLVARRLSELGYDIKVGKEVIDKASRLGLPAADILHDNYQRAINQGGDPVFLEKVKDGYTAVVASIKRGKGPTIALRFDLDALEITEADNKDHLPHRQGFSSDNQGIMHACGHDFHAAIGLGLAEIFSRLKEYITGEIRLIFQPAEEGVRGAKALVSTGILQDVDYIIGHHLFSGWAKGEIMCGLSGFQATEKFDVIFKGQAAHAGGSPEKGKNALQAAATAIVNLYGISRHSAGSTRINIGQIKGGEARNAICDNVLLKLETRGNNSELSQYMYQKAIQILDHSAAMFDCELIIDGMGSAPTANSDLALSHYIGQIADKIKGLKIIPPINLGGSEDFSYMMRFVQEQGGQASFIGIGADIKGIGSNNRGKLKDKILGAHTSRFDLDEKAILPTMILLANSVYELSQKKAGVAN